MLLMGLILLWIYGYRIAANPLTWEEPRRCLVALEMIYRGDYIVSANLFDSLFRGCLGPSLIVF
jgi:hypothetical protein